MKTATAKRYVCERTGQSFEYEEMARASENKISEAAFADLKRKIKSGKFWVPKVGEWIYVRTMMSIDHGEDDVQGGLAMVTRVYDSMSGGDPKCKFVEIAQHDRGGNWTQFLFPEQKELMKRHGKEFACPDPDYGYAGDPNGGFN
jgi:hypothetical protein